MAWVEFLDTFYNGFIGRASVTAVGLGFFLMMISIVGGEDSFGKWPEVVAFTGFMMWLISGGTLAIWAVLRLLTWTVTGV